MSDGGHGAGLHSLVEGAGGSIEMSWHLAGS